MVKGSSPDIDPGTISNITKKGEVKIKLDLSDLSKFKFNSRLEYKKRKARGSNIPEMAEREVNPLSNQYPK